MKHRAIKVNYDDIEEIYKNKAEVARKFGYTTQHIHGILKGLKKDNFIVHDGKVIYISYANNDNEDDEAIKKEKRKEYNKRAYDKKEKELSKIK